MKPIQRSLETYCLFNDAASEVESAGLGGWMHGEWWQLALSAEDRELLHITALEFVALGINIIFYGTAL